MHRRCLELIWDLKKTLLRIHLHDLVNFTRRNWGHRWDFVEEDEPLTHERARSHHLSANRVTSWAKHDMRVRVSSTAVKDTLALPLHLSLSRNPRRHLFVDTSQPLLQVMTDVCWLINQCIHIHTQKHTFVFEVYTKHTLNLVHTYAHVFPPRSFRWPWILRLVSICSQFIFKTTQE